MKQVVLVCDRCGSRLEKNGDQQATVRLIYKDGRRGGSQSDLCGTCVRGFQNFMARYGHGVNRRQGRRDASSTG